MQISRQRILPRIWKAPGRDLLQHCMTFAAPPVHVCVPVRAYVSMHANAHALAHVCVRCAHICAMCVHVHACVQLPCTPACLCALLVHVGVCAPPCTGTSACVRSARWYVTRCAQAYPNTCACVPHLRPRGLLLTRARARDQCTAACAFLAVLTFTGISPLTSTFGSILCPVHGQGGHRVVVQRTTIRLCGSHCLASWMHFTRARAERGGGRGARGAEPPRWPAAPSSYSLPSPPPAPFRPHQWSSGRAHTPWTDACSGIRAGSTPQGVLRSAVSRPGPEGFLVRTCPA
jgi:hypothetical protein